MSDALLEKLRNGYAAFLDRLGEVQTNEQGAIARDDLAQSDAIRCFGLTAGECETLMMRLVPRTDDASVAPKVLLRLLSSCMDYHGRTAKAPGDMKVEPVGAEDVRAAQPTLSWTALDASDTLAAAGNSEGCIVIVRLDGGNEICRFQETMQPKNGKDLPQLRRSPVTAVRLVAPWTVISGSQDGVMRVWDVSTQSCLWYCSGHTGPVAAVTASCYPLVASAASGRDCVPRLWNIGAFDPYAADRAQQKFEGHEGNVLCLDFVVGNDILVATGGLDATVRIWRCDDGVCMMVFKPGRQAVTCIAAFENMLVTGSKDACIQVWDVANMRHHCTFAGHCMAVTSVDIADDRIVSSSEDGHTMVWSVSLRSPRFSMDNQGLQSRKPDARKNVPEKVILQAVQGDNLVTKTQFGYPTLRIFNSNWQQVSRKTGPCGFMSGNSNSLTGAARDQAHVQTAPPPTPCTANRSPMMGGGWDGNDRGGMSSVGSVMSASSPGSSWLPPTSTTGESPGELVLTGNRSPVLQRQKEKSARGARIRGETNDVESQWKVLPATGDDIEFPRAVDLHNRGAWGRRGSTSGAATTSPTRALDSRYRRHDFGVHLEAAAFRADSRTQRQPLVKNQFHIAGERDHTTTDDPSYRAWKHKWMRSRGAADPRVDGALLHASMLHHTFAENKSFLLPLDHERLNQIQAASGRGSVLGGGGVLGAVHQCRVGCGDKFLARMYGGGDESMLMST